MFLIKKSVSPRIDVEDLQEDLHLYEALGLTKNILGRNHLVRTQNFPKTSIAFPLTRTRMCAYQGVSSVSFRKILRTY